MKNRTIGKEPVLVGKMDRFHFPVNQHFVTNRYKNGRIDRGFWNPGYKMLGERVVPQVFVTILLQKFGSRSRPRDSDYKRGIDLNGTKAAERVRGQDEGQQIGPRQRTTSRAFASGIDSFRPLFLGLSQVRCSRTP